MIRLDELKRLGIDVQTEVFLKDKTWLGVGGKAEFYIDVQDEKMLKQILQYADEQSVPITVLGGGSNILVRDGGIKGLVLHLDKKFTTISVQENMLICGAAAPLMNIAKAAADYCISGFEFMSGIPGTLGGGFKTNAGAYGSDLGQITTELIAMDNKGETHILSPQQDKIFDYRTCKLPTGWIFIQAKLKGQQEKNNEQILARMQEYKEKRQASQPLGVRTAGSTFKNPAGASAWKLLDSVGLRGYTQHHAQFSEKHPNFLINMGGASAEDLEELIILAQKKVQEKTGTRLECEVKILGEKSA